jgi:hypothetical protein
MQRNGQLCRVVSYTSVSAIIALQPRVGGSRPFTF